MNDIDTKFNRKGRNDDVNVHNSPSKSKLALFRPLEHPLGQGVPKDLSFEELNQILLYVLHNCDALVEFVEQVYFFKNLFSINLI